MNNENIKKLRNKYNWIEAFFLETMISIGIFITLFICFLYKFRKEIYLFIVNDTTIYVFKINCLVVILCLITYLLFYYTKIIKYKKLLMKLPLNHSELKELKLNTDYEIVEFYIKNIKVSPITGKPIFLNHIQEQKIEDILKFYLVKIFKEQFLEQDNFPKIYNYMNQYNVKLILANIKIWSINTNPLDNILDISLQCQDVIELNDKIKFLVNHLYDSYCFYIKIDKL